MPGPSNAKRKKKANGKTKNKLKRNECDSAGSSAVGGGKPGIFRGRLSPELPKREANGSTNTRQFTEHTKSESHSSLAPLDAVAESSHQQDQLLDEYLPSGVQVDINLGISESSSSESYPPSPLLTPEPTPTINLLDPSYSFACESFYESHIRKNPSTERIVPEDRLVEIEKTLQKPAVIHDPGNGPRVRNVREFMKSEFFAQPPSRDDPLCAEFAQPEVLQMLQTVLPEESAMILWYNKSRSASRICPSCQRLYRLGDTLPEIILSSGGDKRDPERPPHPQLSQEQRISGLCSPVCFVLASFMFQEAIKGAWGKMAEDIDDETWELLNAPQDIQPRGRNDTSAALGMMVRMTRLHDLGLAQLLFDQDDDAPPEHAASHEDVACSTPASARS
ncbi:hypothetical protein NMY22_g11211 [Coprinellus aureogranulatus]|nr:hypothetical protein NMY22_g11211 [Coprinellus aureogranulatus]